ncbi:MAG: ABC transporter permease [Paracoccaceae bacterium]|jgi:spermidine/putrescine transport system permease protein
MSKNAKYLRIFVIICLIFFYGPAILLPLFAFNASQVISFPLEGFTLHWFSALLSEKTLHGALWNSLFVATSASIFGTGLGVLTARAQSRYEFLGKKPSLLFVLAPLVIPELIIGVALLIVLVQLGLSLNLWTVILGHTLLIMPFSTLVMISAFNNLDQSMEEASLDLGETTFGTFRRIILPMVAPGLLASFLIGFTISLDEFMIAFFLSGTEPTLPVYIWAQFRFPVKLPGVMALGTILLIFSLLLLSFSEYFRRRMSKNTTLEIA